MARCPSLPPLLISLSMQPLLALDFEKIIPFLNSRDDVPLEIVDKAAVIELTKEEEAAIAVFAFFANRLLRRCFRCSLR
jgi:hypothetical protein